MYCLEKLRSWGIRISVPKCKNNTPVYHKHSQESHQKSERNRGEYLMFFPHGPLGDARKSSDLSLYRQSPSSLRLVDPLADTSALRLTRTEGRPPSWQHLTINLNVSLDLRLAHNNTTQWQICAAFAQSFTETNVSLWGCTQVTSKETLLLAQRAQKAHPLRHRRRHYVKNDVSTPAGHLHYFNKSIVL